MKENKQTGIVEYTTEILPLFRALEHQQNLLKDFKSSDDGAIALVNIVKDAQAELKKYCEADESASEYLDNIKTINREIKEAVKAAVKVLNDSEGNLEVKPAGLKGYYKARASMKVEEAVEKGELFHALDEKIDGVS